MVDNSFSSSSRNASPAPRKSRVDFLNPPVRLDIEEAKTHLHWKDRPGAPVDLAELIREAESLLQPEAAYKVSYIEKLEGDVVVIEGVSFPSQVLRRNLDPVERVFPYIITIGISLEKHAGESGDPLKQYYLESLADLSLGKTAQALEAHLKRRHGLSGLSSMSPGSLEDWPITQQQPLFSLFEDAAKPVGVRLTEHLLMVPRKSISGVFFPAETSFQSCQLCPRKDCPGRRASFDRDLRRKFRLEG
jgi:hypothetical protein